MIEPAAMGAVGKRSLLVVVLLCISVDARPATAQDELPTAHWGVVAGLRQNLGEAGDAYGSGWLLGFSAMYDPTWSPVGAVWTWMFGEIAAADPGIVDRDLSVIEMSFGLHGRLAVPRTTLQYVVASVGGSLLRSENTLPPDDGRTFVGPYAALGWERYFFGRVLAGVEGRYGLIAGGPAAFTLQLSFHIGNR